LSNRPLIWIVPLNAVCFAATQIWLEFSVDFVAAAVRAVFLMGDIAAVGAIFFDRRGGTNWHVSAVVSLLRALATVPLILWLKSGLGGTSDGLYLVSYVPVSFLLAFVSVGSCSAAMAFQIRRDASPERRRQGVS